MINHEVAKIFYEISAYLAMRDIPFKPQAYEKAAMVLESLAQDIAEIYKHGGEKAINEIPGVGKSMTAQIVEFIKTGKIKEHQRLKKKMPVDIEGLTAVEGMGPKMVRDLYNVLKIKNLTDLGKAARAGKIRGIPRFGEKTEQNILQSIEFLKRSKGRFLLGHILPRAEEIIEELRGLKEVRRISPAGSVRRMKETIGDVDILVTTSNPKKALDYFVAMPGIVKIWGRGPTKASIRLDEGFDVDLRVLPESQFGSALQYFTGSKEHNIATRKIAMDKGLKLNEYGVFLGKPRTIASGELRDKKMIAGKTEEEVYKAIGLPYIEPEMRENQGEIEAAIAGRLPKVIGYNDIKGDLHIHSDWDGGKNSIEDLANEAMKMGYEYIGISDHTKFLRIEHGLDEKKLLKRNQEITKINYKLQTNPSSPHPPCKISEGAARLRRASNYKFRVLKGCEANIMSDGSIDVDDEVLAQLDYVIAGVHSRMKISKKEMTNRIIKAMRNPNVDIISHPTGRILHHRDEYRIDFDMILRVAKETGTILEINASPERLDLNDYNIRRAVNAKVKLIINSDAHEKSQLPLMKFGIAQARRGWAEKKDIVNVWPLEKLLKILK